MQGAGRRERLGRERALWWGVVSALGMRGEEGTTLAQILSRGQIMSVSREPRTALTSVSVLVDHRLAPSFYFVAFYYHGGLPVANSLRVDVQAGACEGKVTNPPGGRDGVVEGREEKLSPL